MPRPLRVIAVGVPYHITQRGNHHQDVFFADEERVRYLRWLIEYSRRYAFDVLAYCLMTNHVHIVGRPNNESALSRTIQMTHSRHTQAINMSQKWSGHLWQGRFFSTMLDERHLFTAVRYVEQNPVRAGMVERPEDYPWSSAASHCGLRDDPVVATDPEWRGALQDWSEYLMSTLDAEHLNELRTCTSTGKPCGNDEFVARVSAELGSPLQRRQRGRPRSE